MITDYLYFWFKASFSNIAAIKLIQIDWDQDDLDNPENQIINTPATLIDISDEADTSDLGDGLQEGEMEITVKLITKSLRDGDQRLRHIERTDNHADIARQIHKLLQQTTKGMISEIPEFAALQGTDNDFALITSISRVNHSFDKRHSQYIRSEQVYKVRFQDPTACQQWSKVIATLELPDLEILD